MGFRMASAQCGTRDWQDGVKSHKVAVLLILELVLLASGEDTEGTLANSDLVWSSLYHTGSSSETLYSRNASWDLNVNLLVYIHVQKCAGSVFKSSLETVVQRSLAQRHPRVFRWFPVPDAYSYKHGGCHALDSMHCTFSEIQTCLLADRAVLKHLGPHRRAAAARSTFVTILRQPVQRVVSEFFWGRRNWCQNATAEFLNSTHRSEQYMWHSRSCLHANNGRFGNFPKAMTHVFSEQDLINWVKSPENLSHNRLTKHLLAWDPESSEQWGTPLVPSLSSGRQKCASHDYTRYRAAWEARYTNTSQVAINHDHLQQAKSEHLEVDRDLRKKLGAPDTGSEGAVEMITPVNGHEHGLEELINKDSKLMHKAAETLSKHFWFVGLQENIPESIHCFQQLVANATAAVLARRAEAGETDVRGQAETSSSTRRLLQLNGGTPAPPNDAHDATVPDSNNAHRQGASSHGQDASVKRLSKEQWQRRWLRRGKDPHRSLAPKSRISQTVKNIIAQYNALDMALYKNVQEKFLLRCANSVQGIPGSEHPKQQQV
mmetsp:Transcript_49598/g.92373  ORF Transcript_49598/g.92373 Transcript_49598/m.92373 type:complete len:546 (+) Transcript_49598:50-1687(+)